MTASPVHIAHVGYGYWGVNLLRCFAQTRNAEVTTVCEPVLSRHEEIARLFPAVRHLDTGLAETLARPEIDAVVLATPAALHFTQAREALLAGKHVFVEKPLAMTSDEAGELTALASARGLRLMVGHTFLYNDAVRWIKSAIDSGELGQVYYISMQRLALGRVRQDVDALWNLAPHDVSIALYWLGERPSTVNCQGMSFLQPGIDDLSFLTLGFPTGRLVHIQVSWLDPTKTRRAVIVGSKKMVIYDDVSLDQKITIYDKGIDVLHMAETFASEQFHTYAQFAIKQRAGDITIPHFKFREPLQVEAQHFVDCVASGETPLSDGASGRDVVAILEAGTRSRQEARTVELT